MPTGHFAICFVTINDDIGSDTTLTAKEFLFVDSNHNREQLPGFGFNVTRSRWRIGTAVRAVTGGCVLGGSLTFDLNGHVEILEAFNDGHG